MVRIYFFLVRLAAFFGNRKAKLLVTGQGESLSRMEKDGLDRPHSSSVGEFEQVRPIIERLKAEGGDTSEIIVTFFSPSGYEMRKDYELADGVYYLPFATRRNARRMLDLLKPDIAVFVKYEFWPAYLKELKARQIPTYLISSVFRKGQLFFRPWGKPYLNLLRCFTHIYVQDAGSEELLLKHNINNVSIAGDTRFDRVTEIRQQERQLPVIESFLHDEMMLPYELANSSNKVIVAGSTWPIDEMMLKEYMADREDTKLIIAPHEITEEHLNYLFQLFEGRFVRYSEATRLNINRCNILIIDTMGLLQSLYRYATVAYVGGAFGAGLHNTLEAAVWGVPVIFGKKYKRFREAAGLIEAGAAISAKNGKELYKALDYAFNNSSEMGQKAAEYVMNGRGATDKIYNEIFV